MSFETSDATALLADIGGTNARFALLAPDGTVENTRVLACEDHLTLEAAAEAYLEAELPLARLPGERPLAAAIAVAAPVTGDEVRMTNHPWAFSISELQAKLGLGRLRVVNDFTAVAAAIPLLSADGLMQIGGGAALPAAPIGIIGPGTGLGVSSLIPVDGQWVTVPGEGGHVTLPPANARESAVLELMRKRFDHVSAERILCGPGLVNLYNALAELDGVPAVSCTPAQITDPNFGTSEPLCQEAVEIFCAMLGTVAGNLALTLYAQGGIYIAGGIIPRLGAAFGASGFRKRFEAKGRMHPILEAMPVYVITHPFPAFTGLGALLAGKSRTLAG